MNTSTLHQLWFLIEETRNTTVSSLNDGDLVIYLLQQLQNQKTIELKEIEIVKNYLNSRLLLIRDLSTCLPS